MREWHKVKTAAEAEAFRQIIEEATQGSPDVDEHGRIDWDSFLYRLEKDADIDLGSDMRSPAIRRIQKIVREYLREEGGSST